MQQWIRFGFQIRQFHEDGGKTRHRTQNRNRQNGKITGIVMGSAAAAMRDIRMISGQKHHAQKQHRRHIPSEQQTRAHAPDIRQESIGDPPDNTADKQAVPRLHAPPDTFGMGNGGVGTRGMALCHEDRFPAKYNPARNRSAAAPQDCRA